ncbi:MAG: MBL fold metallo-hydrolase [Chloroflexi bacterium]|nr:MBL fold metallo-hydrolase [Chloroflexota bacterium]MDA8188106.1 MBL fold metallo-hydrolase [Dehalococcoidales bacterium]
MEIVPGVHKLEVPIPNNPLGHLNSYLIQGDKGCLLIDTGWNTEEAFRSLQDQLRALALGLRDISLAVITHVHPDHYGLTGRIKQVSPVRFAFHLWERAFIESRYIHFDELQQKMGQFFRQHGVPAETAAPLERASLPALDFVTIAWPDEVLYGGEVFTFGEFELEVLWTPGHSPGHVCLYEPSKKLLFSGDHVLPTITPNVSYHLQSGSNPLGDYLHSLNQLKRLPVNLVLPAHEHVFQDVTSRIEEILRHHEERKQQILAIIDAEPKTAYAIATQLSWNVPGKWQRLDALHQRFAVTEVIAHLESLRMDGEVERFPSDGIIQYGPPASS